MKRYKVTLTAVAGVVTGYSPRLSGKIHQIEYVKPGAAAFDDGVDFTITGEATGVNLWTESNVNATARRAPRQPTHTQAGVAATLDGTVAALEMIALANDRVKIVIAQGGTGTGSFHILVE